MVEDRAARYAAVEAAVERRAEEMGPEADLVLWLLDFGPWLMDRMVSWPHEDLDLFIRSLIAEGAL